MEIKQQFVVDGQTFDSLEDAQAYIDSNQDRRRVDAFVAHLKETGKAERVSKKQTDLILDFIKYEQSVRDCFELEQEVPEEGKSAPAATEKGSAGSAEAESGPKSTEDAPTATGQEEDYEPGEPAATAPEQEEPSSEPAQDAEDPAGSKHVDGPDETLEEDPLAGLDI